MAKKYEYEEVSFDDNKRKKVKSSKKSKATGIGVAIYLLVLIVLFILFVIKLPQLKKAWNTVTGNAPVTSITDVEEIQDESTLIVDEDKVVTIKVETEREEEPKIEIQPEEENPKEEKNIEDKVQKKEEKKEEKPVVSTQTQIKYTELQLCFVEIDADGSVIRRIVKRSIPKNDAPLTTAINLLLEGPDTTKSSEKNCMSLIPKGTKLLSAKVSNGVAYLNFNENFERNQEGVEGYISSLVQIVYTATAFNTVNSVQFLIEGENKKYLSEGVSIEYPLTRNSF